MDASREAHDGTGAEVMTGELSRPEPDVNAEFAAFRDEFLEHVLDAYDVPEDLRQLWRELR